jgi:CRISPR-associated protein Cas2
MLLAVYDIADNHRRLRLSNLLEGYGRRVQESVFECFVTLEQMPGLFEKAKKLILVTEDNLRFYWIPSDALPRTLSIGSAPPESPPSYHII